MSPGNGHGMITIAADQTGAPLQVMKEYEDDTRSEMEARLGPRAKMLNPVVRTVFPRLLAAEGQLPLLPGMASRGPA